MHSIQIGTCGWSYPEWSGVFYPAGTAAGEFLSVYAERFHIVEVDSTFYRTPSLKMVQNWRDRTPAGFGFSLKVPQVVTHEKMLLDCAEETEAFVAAVRVLGEKLRCCVLQFGYFNKEKFASLDAFLERLDPYLQSWPKDVQLGIEVRNKWWMTKKLADLLRAHQVVWVVPDQAWMPPPLELVKKLDVVTGPFAYVRLLGDRAEVDKHTKKLDHIVVDRSEQIKADAEAIRHIAARVPVVVFVNNHFAGYAPSTIEQLQAALNESASPI
jgi:uncharacterized protein YecE (DUF72 family)